MHIGQYWVLKVWGKLFKNELLHASRSQEYIESIMQTITMTKSKLK